MVNAIRRVLLLIALSVVGLAGFYYLKSLNTSIDISNVKVKVMEDGVDVEIENFKITHENEGIKEWELRADLAQVNNQQDVTRMQNVVMVIHKGGVKQYTISADSGIYKSSTEDVNLEGNVKLVGPAEGLRQRLSITPKQSN
ncbi:MAG: LPS export ABC transporter periplasmic protein LptC [Nitrospinae bacterium]|nr:LPS export ABC transporter periplasmic protein LptC [Nitrospinota bacterium]MZH42297.1 LPS export ABC transporter periplasmic protein LptC [Nitrospinota bacterium]MZH45928.1 LPS export ABC transporter periplasmic protein LptC [Nitrospinota bacterium]